MRILLFLLMIIAQMAGVRLPYVLFVAPLIVFLLVRVTSFKKARIHDFVMLFLFPLTFSIGAILLYRIGMYFDNVVLSAGEIWRIFLEGLIWSFALGPIQWAIFKLLCLCFRQKNSSLSD